MMQDIVLYQNPCLDVKFYVWSFNLLTQIQQRQIALRLLSLVEEKRRNPFTGTGKPEKLKYKDANIWSRRLTEADRIVYMISDRRIDFLQARYHYSDR